LLRKLKLWRARRSGDPRTLEAP